MTYEATSPAEYIAQIPEDRKPIFERLIKTIKDNLPSGFEEGMLYKMPGFYVPLSTYPDGYHCQPNSPLPFINIASQKASINLYHSGIYAKPELHDWFVNEYPKHSKYKLDMGKSCIRFKRLNDIPFDLIADLCQKMEVDEWISIYEKAIKK